MRAKLTVEDPIEGHLDTPANVDVTSDGSTLILKFTNLDLWNHVMVELDFETAETLLQDMRRVIDG